MRCSATIFIPDLSAFNGKKLSEVAEHLISTYSDKYYLPGIEYWQWLCEHKNLADLPAGKEFETLKTNLKDNYCFLFGSTLRGSDGRWSVPYVHWHGSEWGRDARWLGNGWRSNCRVVLLERWLSFLPRRSESGGGFDFVLEFLACLNFDLNFDPPAGGLIYPPQFFLKLGRVVFCSWKISWKWLCQWVKSDYTKVFFTTIWQKWVKKCIIQG